MGILLTNQSLQQQCVTHVALWNLWHLLLFTLSSFNQNKVSLLINVYVNTITSKFTIALCHTYCIVGTYYISHCSIHQVSIKTRFHYSFKSMYTQLRQDKKRREHRFPNLPSVLYFTVILRWVVPFRISNALALVMCSKLCPFTSRICKISIKWNIHNVF